MPHGGYHGTVTMGTDDKGDPKKIQTSYKDDQGIYQVKGGIGTDSFENIQNQDQGMAAKGSQFRDEITAAMQSAGNTGAGIDALTRIKENPELKNNILKEDDKTKLMCLSGVKQYPMRVKCATLSWHTLVSAMENDGKEITTEK